MCCTRPATRAWCPAYARCRQLLGDSGAHRHAVCAVGVVGASLFDNQRDLRMAPGDALGLRLHLHFYGVRHREGPNWISDQGSVSVYAGDRQITTLHPRSACIV
ncbi:cytochrome c-type biogenesis CcmF C-terminal domain-containing protein [Halopseudomonas pachastrellae]|nr:cytochrome c-type biogenesis CcmF C-terminal domain-containing protein [Halopseudomonas pachastrellae]